MINSIFNECSWDYSIILKKYGIEYITKEILILLEITSSENGYDHTVFNFGMNMLIDLTFYDEYNNTLSEREIIDCRNYFNKIRLYDNIENYLYNSYRWIKEITIRKFSTFSGNKNYLIQENSIYLIRAFEKEYYNKNPYLACCCLLSIKKLNTTYYNDLLYKVKNTDSIINVITYCFLVNIDCDLKNELNIAYKLFYNKIEQLSIEKYQKYINILQQFIINLQDKLKLKDWDNEMYIKVINYLVKNYDDMFLFKIENNYEEVFEIISKG